MKKVEAYIKPHKLSDVTMALRRVPGLTGVTVFEVRGWGRGKQDDEKQPDTERVRDFEPHVAVIVFCLEELAEQVVDTIAAAAHTGLRGDGKIYVLPAELAVRISTRERGSAAV